MGLSLRYGCHMTSLWRILRWSKGVDRKRARPVLDLAPIILLQSVERLTLGVRWCLTRTLETGLLTFLDTRIAGQVTGTPQRTAQFRIDLEQRPRHAKLNGKGLARDAAARNVNRHVVAGVDPGDL